MNDDVEVIEELLWITQKKVSNRFEESMKGSEFVCDLMFTDCVTNVTKYIPNRGGSYINFLDRIKNKKATMNPINKKYNKC